MANQKSQHYNWFKGDSSNGKKKSTKDSAKTVWKFTKVFLYFSLFFFSMWGCVQVFIVKTDTSVGRGVEIYSSQNAISPQVTSVHVTKEKDGVVDIYQAKDNVWVNPKEDGQTFDAVIDSIKDSTTAGKAYTLDQANKGGNLVARLVVNGAEVKDNNQTKGIVYANGKPLTYTTKAEADVTMTDISSLSLPAFHELSWDGTKAVLGAEIKLVMPDKATTAWTPSNVEKHAINFNIELAKAIYNIQDIKDVLKDVATNLPTTAAEVKAYNETRNGFLKLLALQQDKDANKKAVDNQYVLTGHAFGFSSNKYTPISTWGQAWDMHRGAGPFYGIFVYPIAWVTNKIVDSFPMMAGWESFLAIVIVVVVISMITFLLSFKGTLQQTKMQELNAKKAVIDAKYAPYKGNKQMEMRQKQEVSELYKKEGINPMSSLVTIFVTMPFFFAMWRVIGSIQHIKGTTWLGMNFAATSYKEVFSNFTGSWQYIPLMLLAAGIQVFSQIYPRLLTKRRDKNRINVHQKAAMKKGNKMQNIMLIVFAFMALIFTAGLQVYFIVRSLWRLIEVQATHHILVRQRKMRTKKSAA